MSKNRFPKQLRLLRASEFERVFAARNSVSGACLVLFGAPSDLGHARLGLTVSRRVGGAVQRNRWKRLLREAFRLMQDRLPAIDMICVVRAANPPALNQLMETIMVLSVRVQNRIERPAQPCNKNPT
jgi:ribonuclease P protein component